MRRKTRPARNAREYFLIRTRKKAAVMNEVEKRELFEQERKMFEAGVQPKDKRSAPIS